MESRSFMLPVGLLVAFIASVASSQTPSGAQPSPASVDKIFEAWNKPDAPGCALGVISDGVLVYSAGYGMANIEHGVRNSAGAVFHIASISKQFTAFAIHLLVHDGKLALDDDIVKRVSGKSLREFTAERIFAPLAMTHTRFQDDYGFVIKNRASSYAPQPNGPYKYIALSYSNVGATSLHTTVEDLARWDANFYDARVGGEAVRTDMLAKGRLNSGKEISYASALVHGECRGLKVIEHAALIVSSSGKAWYCPEVIHCGRVLGFGQRTR